MLLLATPLPYASFLNSRSVVRVGDIDGAITVFNLLHGSVNYGICKLIGDAMHAHVQRYLQIASYSIATYKPDVTFTVTSDSRFQSRVAAASAESWVLLLLRVGLHPRLNRRLSLCRQPSL